MSTKFNNTARLQKTPAVCKLGPEDLPIEQRQWGWYPLQAFAHWSDSGTPVEGLISGMCDLTPNAGHTIYQGFIAAEAATLDLSLTFDAPSEEFILHLSYRREDAEIDSHTFRWGGQLPNIPFAAGLFTFDDTGSAKFIQAKIYS